MEKENRKRRLGTVDLDTGELVEGTVALLGRRIKSPYAGGFFMSNQLALLELARDKDLGMEALRVLIYLCGRLDFENYIQLEQKEISEDLGMLKPNVSRAMKLLEDKGIIVRGPRAGKSYVWHLNPNFGWKGKVKNFGEEKLRFTLLKNPIIE